MPKLAYKSDQQVYAIQKNNFADSSGKDIKVPIYQSVAFSGRDQYYVIPTNYNVPSTLMSSGGLFYYDLDANACKKIEDAYFRIKVTVSSAAVTVAPPWYMVKQWGIRAGKSGDYITQYFPEQLILWAYMFWAPDERGSLLASGGANLNKSNSRQIYKWWDNKSTIYQPGTYYIHFPIPVPMFHNPDIDLSHIQSGLRFEMQFQDITISGTNTNFAISDISLVVRSHHVSDYDDEKNQVEQQANPFVYSYLDVIRQTISNKALTVSTESLMALDAIQNVKSAFLLVLIKNSGAPVFTDRTQFEWFEIGDAGQLDLKSPSGTTYLSNGNLLNQLDIYRITSKTRHDLAVQGMYIIPFAENCQLALCNGIMDEYHEFTSTIDNLSITPDATGAAEVQTVTMGQSTSTAGYVKIGIGGNLTDSQAYNVTAANLATAINALPSVRNLGYVATVSASPVTSATFTITWQKRDRSVSTELGLAECVIEGLLNSSTAQSASTAVTTFSGNSNFTTVASGSVTIEVHCYYHRQLQIDIDGRLLVKTL